MNQTPTAFDCQFPYRLSDDEAHELEKLRGLLTVLTDLSGIASLHQKHGTANFTLDDLHETFWGMSDRLETIIKNYQKRSNHEQ